jgi:hypothetical protein
MPHLVDPREASFMGSDLTTPPSDLAWFRKAIRRGQEHLVETSRSCRFRPPTDLTISELSLLDGDGGNSAPIVAEILDLSDDGMKIAISPGPDLRAGQLCLLRFQPDSGKGYQLRGAVRWLEVSTFILVFGIQLLAAASSAPEA